VVTAPGFGGRPSWGDDPDFDLAEHLDERILSVGDRRELDALYGELGTTFLPRDRAPWAMTLVHGLEGGRQAVVVRVHHAIVDGLGALNTLLATTTEEPGGATAARPARPTAPLSRFWLMVAALIDTVRTVLQLPGLVAETRRARAKRRGAEPHPDIPSFFSYRRNSLNVWGDNTRVCGSGGLDLATMKAIGKATGTTVNGVLHAVVAGALRSELLARGEDVSEPCRAAFGIATDTTDADRVHGNFVTPTFVKLRSDLADPLERLESTARSCKVAVEARREAGLDLSDRLSALAPRLLNSSRRLLTHKTSMNPSHVVTANVPGPQQRRWFGDIEVVDWFSFAIAVKPCGINITVHSYDGRMNVGIIADPASLPVPQVLIDRMRGELHELAVRTIDEDSFAVVA
jgi:WS/DGAT/MGAT family acyltransferase